MSAIYKSLGRANSTNRWLDMPCFHETKPKPTMPRIIRADIFSPVSFVHLDRTRACSLRIVPHKLRTWPRGLKS